MRKVMQPVVVLFVLVNVLCAILFRWLPSVGMDPIVLLAGNLLVFVLTLLSCYLMKNGLTATSTTGFLSSVYGSFIMKLFFVGLVVVVYVKLSGDQMNVPAVFTSMVLYLLYTFIEVKGLLLLVKKD
jgi:hypothetical protein